MFKKVLVANRGEIALRIARAVSELHMNSVAVYTQEDLNSLHVLRADEAHELPHRGPKSYLDIEAMIDIALRSGCDALHPGYGFLSENAELAQRCENAGITFVGPSPAVLESFGNKGTARQIARQAGVPIAAGTEGATSLAQAWEFMAGIDEDQAVIIKAVSGGGGRGMRVVRSRDEFEEAFNRAASEAKGAFGNSDVYVEELISPTRHIEVQVLGDIEGSVVHAFERECSIQRRHQKLIEIAPAPNLSESLQQQILQAAVQVARTARVHTLCTMEFLVDLSDNGDERFIFMEANPRLQVEHTVTEEVLGIDLVQAQFRLAAGETLVSMGLTQDGIGRPRGTAVQLRINMERTERDGTVVPTGGLLDWFEAPSGAGIRMETAAYSGYQTTTAFDSLLAKLIAYVPTGSYSDALARAYRATCEFRLEGVKTNLELLQSLLLHPDVRKGGFDTGILERNLAKILDKSERHPQLYTAAGNTDSAASTRKTVIGPAGTVPVTSDLSAQVVAITVLKGDHVTENTEVAIVEAMKMEYITKAGLSGTVRAIPVVVGEMVNAGDVLLYIEPGEIAVDWQDEQDDNDPTMIRPDLAKVLDRHAALLDEARPEAVAKRRKFDQRTARENIADLCDPGSFVEYGALAVAAQRKNYSMEELIANTPADGVVGGIGSVNGQLFGVDKTRCVIMAYDYSVVAGTQGFAGMRKAERLLELADKWKLPVIAFPEGGGGRPGETDLFGACGLDVRIYQRFAALCGSVPLISLVSGRCFAGNAGLPACSDFVVGTKNANIGMAGPMLIEGGGLGKFRPEDIGSMSDLAPIGSVDLVVKDEAAAVLAGKRYLSYFQGKMKDWNCADQNLLRLMIPENRLRAYDIREVIRIVSDTDSVLELRTENGVGIVTALVRVEGKPFGLIANNPMHLGGAVDGEAANKAGRFLELCDTYGLPIISLFDTPGFMVGPEEEKTGLLRKVGRLIIAGSNLSVPFFAICLRKAYGVGALGMTAGSFANTTCTVAWPTGEFGGMGIEGEVRLGFRKQLEAIEDPVAREAEFDRLVAHHYEVGSALNMATYPEIDAVIDPADTRQWIIGGLESGGDAMWPRTKRRAYSAH